VLCISFCTRQKDNEGKEEGNYQLLISRLSWAACTANTLKPKLDNLPKFPKFPPKASANTCARLNSLGASVSSTKYFSFLVLFYSSSLAVF
jgi:hypothetical protein